MQLYDIVNMNKCPRVFHDGTDEQRKIHLDPGEKKRGVKLADYVVKFFSTRTDDIKITPAAPEEAQPEIREPQLTQAQTNEQRQLADTRQMKATQEARAARK
jgi:hypothetical protein